MKKIPMINPEEFAILPWGWTENNKKTLKDIRKCGFNLAGFITPDALKTANKAELKGIVFDPEIHVTRDELQVDTKTILKRINNVIRKIKKYGNVFGFYLCDEPSAELFAVLRKWVSAIKKRCPGKIPYINLFPNYASNQQLGTSSYADYVESYIKTVNPPFISYDNYSLMDDGSLRPYYFTNLEIIRSASIRYNLPFWNIVLSNAHFHYAEPTYAGMRFQLYTTLAYGAKGISYFTYFTPPTGNYRLAPIDQFGNKTGTWNILRNINLQIHCLAPIYTKLKSVNVFHHPNVPDGCSGIQTARIIKEIKGDDMLVGEFEGPDMRKYAMVVNKSLHRSTCFSVQFKEGGKINMVNPYSGQIMPWEGENNWLAPGQGMLLCIRD